MDFLLATERTLFLEINNSLAGTWGDVFFGFLTILGHGTVLLPLAFLIILWRGQRNFWAHLLIVLASVGAGACIIHGLKDWISRPRPLADLASSIEAGKIWVHTLFRPLRANNSFPSGHAQLSFGLASALFFLYRKNIFLLFGVAFFISFSRIYIGAHYPSDVLAGALIGTVASGIVYFSFSGRVRGSDT